MQPFNADSLKVLIIAALMVGLNLIIPKFESVIIDIIIRSSTIALIFAVLIYYSKASPDGNAFLLKQLNRFGLIGKKY